MHQVQKLEISKSEYFLEALETDDFVVLQNVATIFFQSSNNCQELTEEGFNLQQWQSIFNIDKATSFHFFSDSDRTRLVWLLQFFCAISDHFS